MHKYATTTPEARELVSELEFVWDQIKSNAASSSSSSPGQLGQSQGEKAMNSSYASIGQIGAGRRNEAPSSGGLRVLRPVSDRDEDAEDNEDEDFQEARGGAYNDNEDEEAALAATSAHTSDLDIRNRKWRKRIERALVTLTTEVAALREQIEAKQLSDRKRRNGIWAWMMWLVWMAIRHALVDLAVLGMVLVWARRKRDKRVEMGVRLLAQYLGQQMRGVLKRLRIRTGDR